MVSVRLVVSCMSRWLCFILWLILMLWLLNWCVFRWVFNMRLFLSVLVKLVLMLFVCWCLSSVLRLLKLWRSIRFVWLVVIWVDLFFVRSFVMFEFCFVGVELCWFLFIFYVLVMSVRLLLIDDDVCLIGMVGDYL